MIRCIICASVAASFLAACSNTPPSIVTGPTAAAPVYPSPSIENRNRGSLFLASNGAFSLYQDPPLPRFIGDTVKIDISESLTGSNKLNTATSRANAVASKGPGTTNQNMNSLLKGLLNMDSTASGSDSFTGTGQTDHSNTLQGRLAATIVNVLPNGNLAIAGEKSIAFNGTINTLRFSGVVNPKDIKAGGIVESEDIVDARLEQVGNGMVADSTSKSWLQKLLTDSLNVW